MSLRDGLPGTSPAAHTRTYFLSLSLVFFFSLSRFLSEASRRSSAHAACAQFAVCVLACCYMQWHSCSFGVCARRGSVPRVRAFCIPDVSTVRFTAFCRIPSPSLSRAKHWTTQITRPFMLAHRQRDLIERSLSSGPGVSRVGSWWRCPRCVGPKGQGGGGGG